MGTIRAEATGADVPRYLSGERGEIDWKCGRYVKSSTRISDVDMPEKKSVREVFHEVRRR